MNGFVIIYHTIFPALATSWVPTSTMAETLIEEGECSRERTETQIIIHQLPRPLPRHLKLLLASTIILVILVSGTIAYFIYAKYKYASGWHRRELCSSRHLFTGTKSSFLSSGINLNPIVLLATFLEITSVDFERLYAPWCSNTSLLPQG